MRFKDRIKELLDVRQPIIHVRSELEKECLIDILNITSNEDINLYTYEALSFIGCESISIGVSKNLKREQLSLEDDYGMEQKVNSPASLNDFLKNTKKRTVVIFNDYQLLSSTSPLYNRLLRIYAEKKYSERLVTFIILSNNYDSVKELDHLTYVLDYDTPEEEDIEHLLSVYGIKKNVSEFDNDDSIKEYAHKLVGFNYNEIINLLDKSIARTGSVDLNILEEERLQEISKSSILDIKKTNKTLDDVGGNGRFKDYVKEIEMCMTDEAAKLGLTPKGHLAVGIAGSAKTFTAEALAASWKVPFIKLELNKILSKFAGESEKNMAKALELVRACAPCVCLIDEVEKVLGGYKSSNQSDSGAIARCFALVLDFLAENNNGVYVVMTSNNVEQLPPELTRSGRLDATFYFGLPNKEERKEIFRIHLSKYDASLTDSRLDKIAKKTDGYTGAEIEQIVKSAVRKAYIKKVSEQSDKLTVTLSLLEKATEEVIPISKSSKEKIDALELWSNGRALKASYEEDKLTLEDMKEIPSLELN